MTTWTGVVGATDNSSGFNVLGSKSMSLAAGDEYVITFVNYNKGAEGTNYWANWAFISDVLCCRADHGDSNPYWGSATNVNYTGDSWSDKYSSIQQWLQAYNGVTVTLTVSRNASGDGITVSHTATANAVDAIASQTYEGAFTATVSAAAAINFYLTVENAHLQITKVVYTSGDNGAIYVAPDHTAGAQWGSNNGASTVDAEKEHYNNDASSAWAGCAYAKFSYSELPNGATLTAASVTYSVYQGGSYSRNDVIYYMAKDFDLNWTTFAGQTLTDLRYTSNRGGKAVEAATTGGTGNRLNLSQSVLSAVSTIYEEGQKYILLQWTGNAGGADLYGKGSAEHAPELGVVYTRETTYTATFVEDNSLVPTVTIYSDPGRTVEISNGSLVNGTYYYTAVCAGYLNYQGSFTVADANPTVHFTMRVPNVYEYTVKAYNGGDEISTIASGSYTEGSPAITVYYPRFMLVGTTLYRSGAGNITYSTSFTPDADNFVHQVAYNTVEATNVAYYTEAENVVDVITANGVSARASNALVAYTNSTYKEVTTISPGNYKIYMRGQNTNSGTTRAFSFKVGETEVFSGNITYTTNFDANNAEEFTVTNTSTLSFSSEGSDKSGVDYFYVIKTGEVASITSAGWATLYTPYALDFSEVDGLKAYTASLSGDIVTLTEVDDVPANTGVVLNGAAGSYNIPVITSSETNKGALIGNATEATAYNAFGGYDLYMLALNGSGDAQFTYVESGSIAAGKAFLKVAKGGSVKAFSVVVGDITTGVQTVEPTTFNAQPTTIFNLAGQRLNKMQKGINIVNGKKVIK